MTGIYKITNPNGLIYIGASKDVENRIKRGYKNGLGKKKRPITNSILEFGFENHTFEVIEHCEISQLNERERYWQEHFNSLHPNGLNMNYVSCNGKKQIASPTTKEKIRLSKIGLIPWNKGLPWSASTKNNISKAFKALERENTKIILDTTTGIYFYGIKDAARAFKKPNQTLKNHLTAPNKDRRENKTNLIIT